MGDGVDDARSAVGANSKQDSSRSRIQMKSETSFRDEWVGVRITVGPVSAFHTMRRALSKSPRRTVFICQSALSMPTIAASVGSRKLTFLEQKGSNDVLSRRGRIVKLVSQRGGHRLPLLNGACACRRTIRSGQSNLTLRVQARLSGADRASDHFRFFSRPHAAPFARVVSVPMFRRLGASMSEGDVSIHY